MLWYNEIKNGTRSNRTRDKQHRKQGVSELLYAANKDNY